MHENQSEEQTHLIKASNFLFHLVDEHETERFFRHLFETNRCLRDTESSECVKRSQMDGEKKMSRLPIYDS
jgi:hypothetical protein